MTRIVYVVLIAVVLVVGIFAFRSVEDSILNCSPPSASELQAQQAFVLAHVRDASDIEVCTTDCDDQGGGYVSFTTAMAPQAARNAFLADTSCSTYSGEDSEDIAVSCPAGTFEVYVFFLGVSQGRTSGELTMR
jgi:hypothetical protein